MAQVWSCIGRIKVLVLPLRPAVAPAASIHAPTLKVTAEYGADDGPVKEREEAFGVLRV